MLYLKQSTASQTVLLGPFVDDTDGATPETGLTIANTDIRLSANGGNMFAKTSGGGTHDENGWYAITLDATDTATVGRFQISCKVAGALTVFMEMNVLEEAIYDSLMASSAAAFDSNQRVDVASVAGTAQTANDNGADINAILIDTNSLNDTKIPQTLNLTASGNIGIDWANVENPTTAVDLSATDTQLVDTVTTYTGNTPQTADHTSGIANVQSDTTLILSGVAGISGSAMRGTDSAALASNYTSARAGYIDNINGHTAQTGDSFTLIGNAGVGLTYITDDLTSVLADTNELQTDWADAGRLDAILDSILAMLDDTRTEPGDLAPPVNPDAMTKLDYVYKFMRNKIETTATRIHIYDDAGTNKDHSSVISDDATTFTRGEFGAGD